MGVDYYVCDNCGETFPDCGIYHHCERGHMLCHNCEPRGGWPEHAKVKDVDYGLGWVVSKYHCPACQKGGNDKERLRDALAAINEACEIIDGAWAIIGKAQSESAAIADERAFEELVSEFSIKRNAFIEKHGGAK